MMRLMVQVVVASSGFFLAKFAFGGVHVVGERTYSERVQLADGRREAEVAQDVLQLAAER